MHEVLNAIYFWYDQYQNSPPIYVSNSVFKLKAQVVSQPGHVIGFVFWEQEAIRESN